MLRVGRPADYCLFSQLRRNILQRLVRKHIGMLQPFVAPFEHFRETSRQNLHGENLLHAFFKAQEGNRFPGLDIDHPHAAGAFIQAFHQRYAAEDGAFTNLAETDESQRTDEVDAAREAGSFVIVCQVCYCRSTRARLPSPDSSSHRRLS